MEGGVVGGLRLHLKFVIMNLSGTGEGKEYMCDIGRAVC